MTACCVYSYAGLVMGVHEYQSPFEGEEQNGGEMLSTEPTQSTPTITQTMADDNVISCNQAQRHVAAAALTVLHTDTDTHTHTHTVEAAQLFH